MIRFIENLGEYSPKNEYSEFIKSYYTDIIIFGTKKYISNIDVEIKIIEVNNTLIPISFGNNKTFSCFSSSIRGMFEYLIFEAKKIDNTFIKVIIQIFGYGILTGIDITKIYDVIFVNNILLSTNIYPKLRKEDFQEIKDFLLKHYPKKGIIFRSIKETDQNYIKFLEEMGSKRIIFRQVFLSYKEKLGEYNKIKEVKSDKHLYEKSNYTKITKESFSDKELGEIKACYDELYLKKYSNKNPQLTLDFYRNLTKNKYFHINFLENLYGEINAAYCYYSINKQVTAPIFGYKNEQLYRHITHTYIFEGLEKADILNWSSGVGKFKMNRGAEKTTEFFLVFFKNLSLVQRIIWNIILFFSIYIGEKFLKKNII